jgi:hypothetical protein
MQCWHHLKKTKLSPRSQARLQTAYSESAIVSLLQLVVSSVHILILRFHINIGIAILTEGVSEIRLTLQLAQEQTTLAEASHLVPNSFQVKLTVRQNILRDIATQQ